ncbi:TetR/AcrR family transcriptional regulator [Mycobacterium timonense]|uniref:TetR family transcriptional regulator n=1 Tax=Mycobacterium timonense TaxID=701043 RepID=A0A7I9Z8Z2_9MYCO|nr:TetR/AcrR family transcriptional regulator [Mycobacterium timonense]GFG97348.1 TetR family transcriptional regulator [Mycobacterium timonense]
MSSRQPLVGRRERTRRALTEAALKRFAAFGVAGTSIADITADVGVAERTFYRHFASKEEVLFADYDDRIDWFRRALEVRPKSESIIKSVRLAVDAFPADYRLVTETARLRASELTQQQIAMHLLRVQGLLASEIEAHLRVTGWGEPADELRAAVVASMISAAVFAAINTWGRRGAGDLAELGPMVEEALTTAEFGVLGAITELSH